MARQRLLEVLNEGVRGHRKLSLVLAPAGAGKTTLLVDWIHQQVNENKYTVAWVSLDERDNDFNRFLSYVIAALQNVDPSWGQTALTLLNTIHARSDPAQSVEIIVGSLLNELSKAQFPLILVLDDYHVIHEPTIHQSVQQLLSYLPPQMHVMITSRNEPPFAIARLRASRTDNGTSSGRFTFFFGRGETFF